MATHNEQQAAAVIQRLTWKLKDALYQLKSPTCNWQESSEYVTQVKDYLHQAELWLAANNINQQNKGN